MLKFSEALNLSYNVKCLFVLDRGRGVNMKSLLKNKFMSSLQKMKWPMIVSLIILFLGFNGYFIIIFGGGLIVDEEQLILDETTIIETTEGKMIGKLYNENRIFISIEEIPDHVLDAFVAVEDTR